MFFVFHVRAACGLQIVRFIQIGTEGIIIFGNFVRISTSLVQDFVVCILSSVLSSQTPSIIQLYNSVIDSPVWRSNVLVTNCGRFQS